MDKNSPGCVQVPNVMFAMAVFTGTQDDLNVNVTLGYWESETSVVALQTCKTLLGIMLKSCLNKKINCMWVGAPHTGTTFCFTLLNGGYASATNFKITTKGPF